MSNRSVKKRKTAKKIKILKVEPVPVGEGEPEKHLVQLEVEGAQEPPPVVPLEEPVVLELEAAVPENSWMKWLKSWW